jgi:hypothetical protein
MSIPAEGQREDREDGSADTLRPEPGSIAVPALFPAPNDVLNSYEVIHDTSVALAEIRASERSIARLRRLSVGSMVIMIVGFLFAGASAAYSVFRLRPLENEIAARQQRLDSIAVVAGVLSQQNADLTRRTGDLQRRYNEWVNREILDVVHIQYSDPVQLPIVRQLRTSFRQNWVAAADGQRVRNRPATAELRYFHVPDSASAESASMIAQRALSSAGCTAEVTSRRIPGYAERNLVRRGSYELYLPADCRPQDIANDL